MISMARFNACSDPRMSYSLYIMLKGCTEGVPNQLIWNWDATQMVVNTSGVPRSVCMVNNAGIEDPITVVGEEALSFCIKWFHLGSANGECAPLVLMAAIDELDEEDCFCFPVPGLSQSNQSGSIGYIAFCKNRCGNSKFFEWFISEIAIPTIAGCRVAHRISVGLLS